MTCFEYTYPNKSCHVTSFDNLIVNFRDGSTSEKSYAYLGCSTVGRGVAHPDEGPVLLEFFFGRVKNTEQISYRLHKYCTNISNRVWASFKILHSYEPGVAPPHDCSSFSIVTSPGSGVCLYGYKNLVETFLIGIIFRRPICSSIPPTWLSTYCPLD